MARFVGSLLTSRQGIRAGSSCSGMCVCVQLLGLLLGSSCPGTVPLWTGVRKAVPHVVAEPLIPYWYYITGISWGQCVGDCRAHQLER